jgi:hypothetical protein
MNHAPIARIVNSASDPTASMATSCRSCDCNSVIGTATTTTSPSLRVERVTDIRHAPAE